MIKEILGRRFQITGQYRIMRRFFVPGCKKLVLKGVSIVFEH